MISEGLSSRANIVLERVSVVDDILLVMSVFLLNLSQLYEGVEGSEEVPVVLSSRFLFCFMRL